MVAVIVLFIIIILVFFVKKTFSGFIYSVGMIDIFLRLITFLNTNLFGGELRKFISDYIPGSLIEMINSYTNGILATILIWIYVKIMIIFEFYIIKSFFHKK